MDKIHKLASSLAKSMEDNDKLATPILAAKLARLNEQYPEDKTIGSVLGIIESLSKNSTFIRKTDFKSLYNQLYSRNTKFGQLFHEELGLSPESFADPVRKTDRDDSHKPDVYQVGDQVLANALNSVFDKNIPIKNYSQGLADKALKSVALTLNSWNLKPSSLKVDTGNDKFLVLKADYDTPKGLTSIIVPIELHNDDITTASLFMGITGPQTLNHASVKKYLISSAGSKTKIDGGDVLNILTKAASRNREISDTEMALMRLNASRQTQSAFFENQIIGQKMAQEAPQDVQLPKSDEFKSFEENFNTPHGVASFEFGEEKLKIAKDHIFRQLFSFGYKNPQITIIKSDKNSVFYGISLDAGKVAFTVPVKFGKDISKPEFLICNGSISNFSQEAINKLYVTNQSDFKVAAAASPLFGLKPSDLINNIRNAISEENYAKAEDALNVLAKSQDEKAYATGFSIFLNGLSPSKKVAETTCSKIVKNASSSHPICSHTGLPIHKVYQDKDGNCRPAYRRGMDETYEGAYFNNSKIFG